MDEIISVIVPIYNSEQTLYRCIKSIMDSDYKNIEIILVNDGSTDKSRKICDEMEQQDKRIKVFHLKNGGVSKARNYGLGKATGKFITFIDSDDFVKTEYFFKLKQTFDQEECQLSVGSVAHIWNETIEVNDTESGNIDFNRRTLKDKELFLKLNQKFLLYGPCNKLYLNKIIIDHNIQFPEETAYGEDLLFNMEYLRYVDKIIYNEQPVYYYDHGNEKSLSHKYREDRFENGIRLNMAIKKTFEEKGFFEEKEKRFVYQRIFDDAYNSIFDLWNPQNQDTHAGKRKRMRSIVDHKEVERSCQYVDNDKYPKKYVWMIKNKKIWLFMLLRAIK